MTAWAVQALLGSALLMALILLIRIVKFVNFAGARAAYALWALPALRLLLPPLPAPVPPGPVDVSLAFATGSAAPAAEAWTFAHLLWPLWLGGAALFACGQVIAYQRFVRRALAQAVEVGLVDGIAVLATPGVMGPVAVGPFRPRILVPLTFNAQPAAERDLALAHEALHHQRGDLWANLLACAVLSLHWFNPLAHLAHRAFRRDQELACDAAVIGGADAATRHQYGRALARAAGALPPAPATTLGETSTLKRRLDMLKAHRARTSGAGKVGMATIGLAALGLTATGGVAAQPAETSGQKIIVLQKRGEARDANAEVSKQLAERCASDAKRTETRSETVRDGKPVSSRVIICDQSGEQSGDRAARLEKARASLSTSPGLDAETRTRLLAALDAAIADAKGGQ